MALIDDINQAIQDEILNDPQGIGYAGKSDDEIAALLNAPQVVARTVYDTYPSPMNRILNGLAGAPNAVAVDDVSAVTQSQTFQTVKTGLKTSIGA